MSFRVFFFSKKYYPLPYSILITVAAYTVNVYMMFMYLYAHTFSNNLMPRRHWRDPNSHSRTPPRACHDSLARLLDLAAHGPGEP